MNLPNCSHFSCRFACRVWTAGEEKKEASGGGGVGGGEGGGGGATMATFLVDAHWQDALASPVYQIIPHICHFVEPQRTRMSERVDGQQLFKEAVPACLHVVSVTLGMNQLELFPSQRSNWEPAAKPLNRRRAPNNRQLSNTSTSICSQCVSMCLFGHPCTLLS